MSESRRPAVHIVSFNSASVIGRCLESLQRHAPGVEIVVVDNCSGDDSVEIIAEVATARGGVQVIRSRENRGFAAAANQAVEASSGDPIILLNPDTEAREGWLERLCEALGDPAVGVAGCKILNPDGQTLQHVGGIVRANGLTDHAGRGDVDRGQYDEVRDVDYVTGAALGMRRQVWDELGGFDEGYFPAYFEELELCWRARGRGYRVIVEPAATVLHVEGASFLAREVGGQAGTEAGDATGGPVEDAPGGEDEDASSTPTLAFYRAYHRNRIRFVLRNFQPSQILVRFVPAEIRWLVTVRPRRQLLAAAYGYLMGALGLPSALLRRPR